jgi:putative copper resistance protein D
MLAGASLAVVWASVFAQAVALGGHNRFFEMPRLLESLQNWSSVSRTRYIKRFAAVLHVESWVLAGVLVTAAVLAASPLPGTT